VWKGVGGRGAGGKFFGGCRGRKANLCPKVKITTRKGGGSLIQCLQRGGRARGGREAGGTDAPSCTMEACQGNVSLVGGRWGVVIGVGQE